MGTRLELLPFSQPLHVSLVECRVVALAFDLLDIAVGVRGLESHSIDGVVFGLCARW